MIKNIMKASAFAVTALAASGLAASATTLEDVKKKGEVFCGVSEGLPGFSSQNAEGDWVGVDVDICKAVAAAIFNDSSKVKYVPLPASARFTSLQSGEIDILSRNTTWTMTRDTNLGLTFAGVNYYDGQGFMVRKELNVKSASELSGASVCTNAGTTTELNVADYFRSNGMEYELVAFKKTDEAVQGYNTGRCDVYTTDASGLYANRLKLDNPEEHIVLPEIISKEPLGPVVRQGDAQWLNIVRWTLNAMINAEELGVTQANVDEMTSSDNPAIKRLLGTEGEYGPMLGLDLDWVVRIVKSVGNYGESFDRHIGPDTELKIARGINALWTNGGILYAPPVR